MLSSRGPEDKAKAQAPERTALHFPFSILHSRAAWTCVGIASISVLTYLPTLRYPLIYDDLAVIERNPVVTQAGGWHRALSEPWWPRTESLDPLYRPLTTLTFKLNCALFGPGALSFRVVNVALHAAVSVMVAMLAGRLWAFRRSVPHPEGVGHPHDQSRAVLGPDRAGDPDYIGTRKEVGHRGEGAVSGRRSDVGSTAQKQWHTGSSPLTPHPSLSATWVAGVLFAVHPIHAEALGLVVGRAELLAALFVCWLVTTRLRAATSSNSIRNSQSTIRNSLVFLAALCSKEHAAIAWPMMIAFDWWAGPHGAGRAAWRTYVKRALSSHHLGMIAALAVFLLARWLIFGGRTTLPDDFVNPYANPLRGLSAVEHAAASASLLWLMLRQWFAASPLCPIWSVGGWDVPSSLSDTNVISGALAILLLILNVVLTGCHGRRVSPTASETSALPVPCPEGANYVSPGQRPGEAATPSIEALKGRANGHDATPPTSGGRLGLILALFGLSILLPCHVIPSANWLYAERWAYLPSVFLALACAGLAARAPRLSAGAVTMVAVLLLAVTIPYHRCWSGQERLFGSVIERQPDSYHGNVGLLSYLERTARLREAGPHADRMAARFPQAERAWYFKTLQAAEIEDWDTAERALRRWVTLQPLAATPSGVQRVCDELRRRGRGSDIEL